MSFALTYKKLVDWAGNQVVKDAEALISRGAVLKADFEDQFIKGTVIHNNRPFQTALRILPDGHAESHCPCWINRERGLICSHVIAIALTLVKRATDPQREEKYQAERRQATRQQNFSESAFIQRVDSDAPGALSANLRITLPADWQTQYIAGRIQLICEVGTRNQFMSLEKVPRNLALTFSKKEEALLYVLDDIAAAPAPGLLPVTPADFLNILDLLAGSTINLQNGNPITVNEPKLNTLLRMDLDHENGELILMAHTEMPFSKPTEFPFYTIAGKKGWIFGADHFWPLTQVLPLPYQPIYREPVIIPRADVVRFLAQDLPRLSELLTIESDLSADLFTIEPAAPSFHLLVKGSPASLSATLFTRYGAVDLIACRPDAREHFGIPDPEDHLRYTVRNPNAEKQALQFLAATGFRGEDGGTLSSIIDNREVLNFLGRHLPVLRRHGWQVKLEGKVSTYMESMDFVTPVVHVNQSPGMNWFDVAFNFESPAGASLTSSEIQTALQKGEAFLRSGSKTVLLDIDAIESMHSVFEDCPSAEAASAGAFRLSSLYAPFVQSSLDALDGIDIESAPEWRRKVENFADISRLPAVTLPEPLAGLLRPYQKDGVSWLAWQETNGFCGILADEMGLGKTIQALAWLQQNRVNAQSGAKQPSLIICPTSLVENWEEEAHRFTPNLKVVIMSGAERHEKWDEAKKADLVITSYALLRRDLEKYVAIEFAVALLDEAQHIKNRSTQNALAAKQIKARSRLVLTGTPVENGVADLWSIMDFLMPGYLGGAEQFRARYELPISRGGQDAEDAQLRLKRKLHPFLLRRLKKDVAKDLPPKIERTAFCKLSPDQLLVYKEILDASRRKIGSMISKGGFNSSRMEILAALLRLRQVCCHLDLLKLPGLKPGMPSGKTDLFFELVEEALDSGHRILVFSQFVSMLKILSSELNKQKVPFCYLDGSTKNRMEVVRQFNTQRDIPLFLISLKAGGTGLNLTGADMVIHYDPWWNPAVENQATDRAYRIGQKRTVYGIKLITSGTVEEKVLELQKKKQGVINATIESDEAMTQSLTREDLENLLEL